MSIRWIKNLIIDGEKSTIEIQIGDKKIGDKCYTRVNSEVECWFENIYDSRNDIIATGVVLISSIIIWFAGDLSFSIDGIFGVSVSLFVIISKMTVSRSSFTVSVKGTICFCIEV